MAQLQPFHLGIFSYYKAKYEKFPHSTKGYNSNWMSYSQPQQYSCKIYTRCSVIMNKIKL